MNLDSSYTYKKTVRYQGVKIRVHRYRVTGSGMWCCIFKNFGTYSGHMFMYDHQLDEALRQCHIFINKALPIGQRV